jgi:superfamily II DNA or RNA helicase
MIVIGTTQSMVRRLDKWPRDYFAHIIVDEAHRNTMGTQAQAVLGYFGGAKVLGVTATPFRSDKKQLGNYYEAVCAEIGLVDLVKQGYLARITVKSIPMGIDLRGVRTTAGDYREDDLGAALEPYLRECARALVEHAPGRKTVCFLPLIETSKKFCSMLCELGVNAVHVDGRDREALRGDWQVICNASLLTTGWDEPTVDCVYILRPTKSLVLYMQIVGRGPRTAPGKENLLLLDPLFLSDRHDLVRPAKLVSTNEEELSSVQDELDREQGVGGEGKQIDLLAASSEAAKARHRTLVEKLREVAKRKSRTIDALDFALAVNDERLANYEPEMGWERMPPTDRQLAAIERAGFDPADFECKGRASMLLDTLFRRRDLGLATPKQVRLLIKLHHPEPWNASFEDASAFIDRRLRQ